MRPSGIWGPKEFAQFTEDELHETMMGAQPGSNHFEWAKAELEHRNRRRPVAQTHNVLNIGTAIHSPVQQAGSQSPQHQIITYGPEELSSLTRLVAELSSHLHELNLDEHQRRRVEAQISTLNAQLTVEPDPVIVQQAGRTIRNITEGTIAGLITAAVQPTVWHWVQQVMATHFPN